MVLALRELKNKQITDGTNSTSGTTLTDTGKDFQQLGVVKGDEVFNETDGGSTVVTAVGTTTLTLAAAGTFGATGKLYRIRRKRISVTGTNTSATANKLTDTGATFITDGIQVGFTVFNDTDSTFATVTAIDSETQLSLSKDIFTATSKAYTVIQAEGFFAEDWTDLRGMFTTTGFLKHEYGGLEFDLSAITTDNLLVGTGAGAVGLKTPTQVNDILGLGAGDTPQFQAQLLQAPDATAGVTLQDTSLTLTAQYWNGAATTGYVAEIIHNITATTPASQLDFDIGGSTKMSLHSTGDLAVDTDTLYVDAVNGKVGIGTTSTTTKLKVYNSSGDAFAHFGNNTSGGALTDGMLIGMAGNDGYVWLRESAYLYLRTNNTNRLTIDPSGLVGHGTTSPATNLHIQENNTDTTVTVEIEQLSTGDAGLQFSIPGDAYAMGIDNSDGDKLKISYGGAAGTAVLGTNDYLTIDPLGNIIVGAIAALATTANDGFLEIPNMAGTPTGAPTAYTGKSPIVYDTTAHKIWVYSGSWRSVAVA